MRQIEAQLGPMRTRLQVGFAEAPVAKTNLGGSKRKILAQDGAENRAAKNKGFAIVGAPEARCALVLIG